MNIFETVTGQARAMNLPLYAVTMTAVDRPAAPVLLSLHWHGFRRTAPLHLPGVEIPPRAVPQSTAQFDMPPGSFDALERSLLDAAWRLGAWDLERVERRAWWRLGAPPAEVSDGQRAFGYYDDDAAQEQLVAEAPDRAALMELAARKGYLRWLFRPRRCGLWAEMDDLDDTLDDTGGRDTPCPINPRPRHSGESRRTVYRLGQVTRVLGPGD